MSEELGKIERLPVENYRQGRKLFFVPLVFANPELPLEYTLKCNSYWEQVDAQISNLEEKLGAAKHLYHELVAQGGEAGIKALQQVSENSLLIIHKRIEAGAALEPLEDQDILTELTDWSRCLAVGLQSQAVFTKVYESYEATNTRRNDMITKKLDETIKKEESAIVIMNEGHHVRFPQDIQVFYVAPPALDDIKRWLRDYETQQREAKSREATPEKTGPGGEIPT